jgi:hypothetical protein
LVFTSAAEAQLLTYSTKALNGASERQAKAEELVRVFGERGRIDRRPSRQAVRHTKRDTRDLTGQRGSRPDADSWLSLDR